MMNNQKPKTLDEWCDKVHGLRGYNLCIEVAKATIEAIIPKKNNLHDEDQADAYDNALEVCQQQAKKWLGTETTGE